MWTRHELKEKAKAALRNNYWKAVLIGLLFMVISGGMGSSSGYQYKSDSAFSLKNIGNSIANKGGDSFTGLLAFNEIRNSFGGIAQDISSMDAVSRTGLFVVITVLFLVIFTVVLAILLLIDAFLFNPMKVGIRRFFVKDLNEKANISEAAYGFDHSYKRNVVTLFLKNLFIFLWSLLLIVPGIIKSYEYRMVVYLLGEYPEMDRVTAFKKSKEMMTGEKWKTFVLDLSFLGWHILSFFTLGLLSVFYVAPYQHLTNAALYQRLSAKQEL